MKAIAIVGMGCRFAGASDLHAYWQMSLEGRDAFGPIPADRWPADVFHDGNRRKADKIYAPKGAFLEDVKTFPALALGLPPRRVEVMDPQQRLSLEVCLQAIEDSGRRPEDLPRKTGVFVGLTGFEYKTLLTSRSIALLMASGHLGTAPADPEALARAVERVVPPRPYSAPGVLGNMSASIVAQELDLHGPAYTLDAACASALVAVNDAVAQLRAGTIDAALAGGAYICLTPDHFVAFSRIGAMSEQGLCLPFDARADGFVQGDGGGAVLLKRLDDALRDGDRIYAVIHGASFNNDGRGDGPMAPVADGQAEVVRDAWSDAGLDPADLGYVETHGTGTDAGDVSELRSLVMALGDRVRSAALGSSKANVGHTMSAAGIAGLIRAALAVHHGTIPPMANFASPKDELRLHETPFSVPTSARAWSDGRRLAAVSSFGFGGTNAHVVLGQAPATGAAPAQLELVALSAPDEASLRDLAARTAASVQADEHATPAGVARAWAKRRPQPARLALVVGSREELAAKLSAVGRGEGPEGTQIGTPQAPPKIAFLYPGQGSQRVGMLADLGARFPIVAETLADLEGRLASDLPMPLTHLLYPERRVVSVPPEQAEAELTDTAACQPVLLSAAVGLTRLLDRVGVRPHVVTGHSLGEFTAAAVAGVIEPHDAARFVARRGRAMADLPGDHGAMAAVMADEATTRGLLVEGAVIANVNHPRQVVVSGYTPAVAEVVRRAEAAGITAKPLAVSHGFHGPALAGLDSAALLDGVVFSDPRVTVASGIDDEPYRDAAHARDVFGRHATSPVVFTRALEQCRAAGADLYLQVGAGGPLASFARGSLPKGHRGVLTLASMDDHDGGRSLLDTLARLWVEGVDLDVASIAGAGAVASVPPTVLPRESYWAIKDKPQAPADLGGLRPAAQAPAPAPEAAPPPAPEAPPTAADDVGPRVVAVIAKVSAYPRDALKPGMTLTEDLGFDSLMVGDLATGLAEAFPGLPGIPQELLIDRPTVQSIVDFVRGAQGGRGPAVDDDAPLRAFAPVWRPTPLPTLPTRPYGGRKVLLVATSAQDDLATALSRAFAAAGHAVTRATPEAAASAEPADAVLWCGFEPSPPPGAVLAGEAAPPDPSGSLIAALDRQARQGAAPDLLAVVRDGDPWAAGLAGVARVVAREWPQACAKCVVTDAPDAGALLAEWASADRTPDVRLVAGAREIAGLAPIPDAAPAFAPGPEDVAVITGGTRGIGAALAARLAATGARVVLVGRGDPSAAARDLIARGATHLRVDVTDRAALAAALAPWRPTVLVHAAGALADGPLGAVDPEQGRAARAVKVDGWLAALAACAGTLKVAVAVGSWAGRFGNRHQAHYAAANATLAALAEAGAPGVRAVVAEFGPWTSSDMARTIPAPVQAAMRSDGVDFVGDAAGLDALWGDLVARSGAVVHGRDLPATSRSVETVELLSVETHPYLADHAIEGVPVWPMASALDAIARAAALDTPFEIADLTLFSGVTVREPTRVVTRVRGDRAEVRVGDREQLAWRARVRPARALPADPGPVSGGDAPTIPLASFYGSITFHGPLLQGIAAIDGVGASFVRGRVRTGRPSDWTPGTQRARFAVDPLAVDSAMQLSAYAAWARFGRLGTPVGIGRYVQLAPFPEGVLAAEVHTKAIDGQRFTGTLALRDGAGRLLAVAEDLVAELRDLQGRAPEFQPKPEWVDPAAWPEVRDLGMRLEGVKAMGLENPYFHVHEGTARDTTVVGGRSLVNFSSYNYLGFSGDPRVIEAVNAAVARYGTSVSASRVASGERPFHQALEAELAAAQGADDALLFTAGHATNVTTIGHLMKPADLVLHDELIHDSALQGIKLSGAARRAFRHDDPEHLEKQLKELRRHYEKVLIAVEGVYSMDGDVCHLPAWLDLKDRYGCLLFVDEAHSFGVVGATGRGVGEHFGVDGRRVDLWMGTLSKSLASCGGWIAGSKPLITYLRYTAPGFVYSAGLTPANGVAALTSLRLMAEEPWRVAKLQANARVFHDALVARGIDTGPAHGESGVVPCITGNSFHALVLSQRLAEQGINVQPIVYPAVADDAARLRFFLSSTHSEDQLTWTANVVADTLAAVRAEHRI